MKGLKYDKDYVIGGPARAKVSPNFALSEYAGADGKVRMHRDLLASVQVLRDQLGMPLRIAGVVPAHGLGGSTRFARRRCATRTTLTGASSSWRCPGCTGSSRCASPISAVSPRSMTCACSRAASTAPTMRSAAAWSATCYERPAAPRLNGVARSGGPARR